MIQTYHRPSLGVKPPAAGGYGGLGAEVPRRWAIFRNFLDKKAILIPLDNISHVFTAIEGIRLLTFERRLKKLSCSVLLLLAI